MTTKQAKLLFKLIYNQDPGMNDDIERGIVFRYISIPEELINWKEVARKFVDMGDMEKAEKALMFLTKSK